MDFTPSSQRGSFARFSLPLKGLIKDDFFLCCIKNFNTLLDIQAVDNVSSEPACFDKVIYPIHTLEFL